jgi:hypothetical protein
VPGQDALSQAIDGLQDFWGSIRANACQMTDQMDVQNPLC